MPRFWVTDGRHVRLSLPWHGVASWDDMHAYVVAVLRDNEIRDDLDRERIARSILLSLCKRLAIEPVGAFTFHLPDDERAVEEARRGK